MYACRWKLSEFNRKLRRSKHVFKKIKSSKIRLQQPSRKGPSSPSYRCYLAPCIKIIPVVCVCVNTRSYKHTRYTSAPSTHQRGAPCRYPCRCCLGERGRRASTGSTGGSLPPPRRRCRTNPSRTTYLPRAGQIRLSRGDGGGWRIVQTAVETLNGEARRQRQTNGTNCW